MSSSLGANWPIGLQFVHPVFTDRLTHVSTADTGGTIGGKGAAAGAQDMQYSDVHAVHCRTSGSSGGKPAAAGAQVMQYSNVESINVQDFFQRHMEGNL